MGIWDNTMDADPGPPMHLRLPPEKVVADLEAAGPNAEVVAESLPRQYLVQGRPTTLGE